MASVPSHFSPCFLVIGGGNDQSDSTEAVPPMKNFLPDHCGADMRPPTSPSNGKWRGLCAGLSAWLCQRRIRAENDRLLLAVPFLQLPANVFSGEGVPMRLSDLIYDVFQQC